MKSPICQTKAPAKIFPLYGTLENAGIYIHALKSVSHISLSIHMYIHCTHGIVSVMHLIACSTLHNLTNGSKNSGSTANRIAFGKENTYS